MFNKDLKEEIESMKHKIESMKDQISDLKERYFDILEKHYALLYHIGLEEKKTKGHAVLMWKKHGQP